jgi:hypothetical protein
MNINDFKNISKYPKLVIQLKNQKGNYITKPYIDQSQSRLCGQFVSELINNKINQIGNGEKMSFLLNDIVDFEPNVDGNYDYYDGTEEYKKGIDPIDKIIMSIISVAVLIIGYRMDTENYIGVVFSIIYIIVAFNFSDSEKKAPSLESLLWPLNIFIKLITGT